MIVKGAGRLACLVVWLCLPVSAASAACADICPGTLLPADNDCIGVTRDGDMYIATDVEELTGPINGAAYLYEHYGFVRASFQNYLTIIGETDVWIMVSLFNQGSGSNAEALYEDPESGNGETLHDWKGSGEARLKIDLLTVTIQFRESCLFGSIVINSGKGDAIDRIRCLADAIVVMIQTVPTEDASWGNLKTLFR